MKWEPTERQKHFIELPDSIFEALFGGAAGGGKTDTLITLPICKTLPNSKDSLLSHPRFKMLFIRRTYPELEREVIPRSELYYKPAGGKYNDGKHHWSFPSGAKVYFGHAEVEKDVTKYDTSEFNIICFDELTSFTEFQYLYLALSRCRTSSPDLPAIIRSGSNPGNVGHSFVRKRFVEPCRDGYKVLQEKREVNGEILTLRRIFIPSKVTDNPHIQNREVYIAALNSLPEADRAAKLYGDWWTFSGQVFDDFRKEPFLDEPKNARHVIEPFPIPEYWPRIIAVDWGYAAMMWAGWFAINPLTRQIYVYREYVCQKTKISTWATQIKNLSYGENISSFVLDPSAWGKTGAEFTIAEQVAQYTEMSPKKADNDRISGKTLFQEVLRWRQKAKSKIVNISPFNPDFAERLRRFKGDLAYNDYVKSFQPEEDEDNLPKLQIFNTCLVLIETIPLCVYDKNNDGKPAEDVAEFVGDDPYDGCRYGIKECHHFLEQNKELADYTIRVGRAIEMYNKNNNVTDFYMKMDSLEKQHERESSSVAFRLRRRRTMRVLR